MAPLLNRNHSSSGYGFLLEMVRHYAQIAEIDIAQAHHKASPADNWSCEILISKLKFLPVFEQPDFSPGEWTTQEGSLPYCSYTSEVLDFLRALSGNGFIQPFDWKNWREGEQLVAHPELLSRANLQTLRKLLTAHVRADCFTEGHLAGTFESGHMPMILKRMAEIHYSKVGESK